MSDYDKELDEILGQLEDYYNTVFNAVLPDEDAMSREKAKAKLSALLRRVERGASEKHQSGNNPSGKQVANLSFDPYDFVEPCEPDCSPERHAYHQGQWDMAGRINKHFGYGTWPGAFAEGNGLVKTGVFSPQAILNPPGTNPINTEVSDE